MREVKKERKGEKGKMRNNPSISISILISNSSIAILPFGLISFIHSFIHLFMVSHFHSFYISFFLF